METVTCQTDKCNRKLGEQSQVFGESPVLEMLICVKKSQVLVKYFTGGQVRRRQRRQRHRYFSRKTSVAVVMPNVLVKLKRLTTCLSLITIKSIMTDKYHKCPYSTRIKGKQPSWIKKIRSEKDSERNFVLIIGGLKG